MTDLDAETPSLLSEMVEDNVAVPVSVMLTITDGERMDGESL